MVQQFGINIDCYYDFFRYFNNLAIGKLFPCIRPILY